MANSVKRRSALGSPLLALLLAAVAAGLYTWGTWRYFTTVVPGGNDFMTHYAAWEAYFVEGLNPYSDEAALYAQQAIYGRATLAGEDENRLSYPFYSFVLHAPFIVLEYPLARSLYMTLLQGALAAGVWLTLRLLAWRPRPAVVVALMIWATLYYPAARGIILGQFAIFGFATLAGTLVLLQARRDAAAGALLVLTTIKPTLVFLVVPFLLLWTLARRRWRFGLAFAAVLGAVTLLSLVMLPTWIGDWLHRIQDYPSYTVGQSPVWLLTQVVWPGLGSAGDALISATLLATVGMTWWRAMGRTPAAGEEFHWALGWTLVVSALIVPRSATTNYVMLLFPTLWVFSALARRSPRGMWLVLSLMAASLVGHWWLHFATVVGNQEQPILFIPWPVLLGAALLMARRWLLADARALRLWPVEPWAGAPAPAGLHK